MLTGSIPTRIRQPIVRTAWLISQLVLCYTGAATVVAFPHFGTGLKIGEVTQDSAIVWARLSATDNCDEQFHLPGVAGKLRVRYRAGDQPWQQTSWKPVAPESDSAEQFVLSDLRPGSSYNIVVEGIAAGRMAEMEGRFRTAPQARASSEVKFVVTTGHKFATDDDAGHGPRIYQAMLSLDPDFFIHTGDVVYYDNDTPPLATTVALARMHWHRMYSLPRRREFHRQVASYFMKDDHDVIRDDCWPGQRFGELTFARGVALFREQNPLGELPYRTVRWGQHLQLWLMEGREYRSPNDRPDGPGKTIWGKTQFDWLRQGVNESNATFKLVVSPTPIVGPDRTNGSKKDNHANQAFSHEGTAVRRALSDHENLFVLCGDRHWQYVSVDQQTRLREFSCGPSTDKHAGGWKDENRLPEHRFLRVAGGFLSVHVSLGHSPTLMLRHHDVDGKIVHETTYPAAE